MTHRLPLKAHLTYWLSVLYLPCVMTVGVWLVETEDYAKTTTAEASLLTTWDFVCRMTAARWFTETSVSVEPRTARQLCLIT
jgi:hypothetical protein